MIVRFDGHDLQDLALCVLAEVDDAVGACPSPRGWRLLESNFAVGDDMTDAILRYAMTCRGARKPARPYSRVYQLCQT